MDPRDESIFYRSRTSEDAQPVLCDHCRPKAVAEARAALDVLASYTSTDAERDIAATAALVAVAKLRLPNAGDFLID